MNECENCGRTDPAYYTRDGRFCDHACWRAYLLDDPWIGADQIRRFPRSYQ